MSVSAAGDLSNFFAVARNDDIAVRLSKFGLASTVPARHTLCSIPFTRAECLCCIQSLRGRLNCLFDLESVGSVFSHVAPPPSPMPAWLFPPLWPLFGGRNALSREILPKCWASYVQMFNIFANNASNFRLSNLAETDKVKFPSPIGP